MKTIVLKHTNTCPRNVKNNEIDKVDGVNALISGMQAKPFLTVNNSRYR